MLLSMSERKEYVKEEVVKYLDRNPFITATQASKMFKISWVTIRKYLQELEADKKLKRMKVGRYTVYTRRWV